MSTSKTPCGQPASNQYLPVEGLHQLTRKSQSVGVVAEGDDDVLRKRDERKEASAAVVELLHTPSILAGNPSAERASWRALIALAGEEEEMGEVRAMRAFQVSWSSFPVADKADSFWKKEIFDAKSGVKTPLGAEEVALSAVARSRSATRMVTEFMRQPWQSRGNAHWDCGPFGRRTAGECGECGWVEEKDGG